MKKAFLMAIILVGLAGTVAHADAVGYVDLEKVFQNSVEARKAEADFQKKQDTYQKLVQEKQAQVEKKRASSKDPAEVNKLVEQIEKELRPQQEELSRLQNELTLKIQGRVRTASREAAKEYNVDVVIDKRVVLTGGFDLTDFVIEKLNAASTAGK
jgi:Skp family chaperone for outer membrane proteins